MNSRVVFVLMLLGLITSIGLTMRVQVVSAIFLRLSPRLLANLTTTPPSNKHIQTKRFYHSLTTLVLLISTLSYFALATHAGYTWHVTKVRETHDHGIPDTWRIVYRELYWVRYVDLFLTTPLVLLQLAGLGGHAGSQVVGALVAGLVLPLTGLFSALGMTKGQKWGWYVFSCLSYLFLLYTVLVPGLKAARVRGGKTPAWYTFLGVHQILVLAAYVVVWAVTDRTLIVGVNGEAIAWGVLDLLFKLVFGLLLLLGVSPIPEAAVEMAPWLCNGFASEGQIRIGDEEGA